MIVKVQLPLATNEPEPFALIYNKDRSVLLHVPVSRVLIAKMNGQAKRYFKAEIDVPGSKNHAPAPDASQVFELGDEVPAQEW